MSERRFSYFYISINLISAQNLIRNYDVRCTTGIHQQEITLVLVILCGWLFSSFPFSHFIFRPFVMFFSISPDSPHPISTPHYTLFLSFVRVKDRTQEAFLTLFLSSLLCFNPIFRAINKISVFCVRVYMRMQIRARANRC